MDSTPDSESIEAHKSRNLIVRAINSPSALLPVNLVIAAIILVIGVLFGIQFAIKEAMRRFGTPTIYGTLVNQSGVAVEKLLILSDAKPEVILFTAHELAPNVSRNVEFSPKQETDFFAVRVENHGTVTKGIINLNDTKGISGGRFTVVIHPDLEIETESGNGL